MYKKGLSTEEIQNMKNLFAVESLVQIPDSEAWAQNVRRYDHRRIHIGGFLDNIVPELMQLLSTQTEDYITNRIQSSQEFGKVLQVVSKGAL